MDNNSNELSDKKEIIYSQTVKAGKRIYYIDVKKSRNQELFLALTESKRLPASDANPQDISYEKHKIFLYQEDFDHFMAALQDAISFIDSKGGYDRSREKDRGNSWDNLVE